VAPVVSAISVMGAFIFATVIKLIVATSNPVAIFLVTTTPAVATCIVTSFAAVTTSVAITSSL